jgi:GTP-binding protein
MTPPVAAIVGRANVGKSTLFNSLAGRRVSIVEPSRGVTRDRVSVALTDSEGRRIELVDTGGLGIGRDDPLGAAVDEQIRFAMEKAAALVFVVDASEGIVPQDREVAAGLRALGKPIVLVASKVESARTAQIAAEFHELGLGEPMLVSALHRRNTQELRERLFRLVSATEGAPERPGLKIAVVGKRNAGKSTFINALAREKRVIVSEQPGTTRDSVDVRLEIDGKVYVAIDTAGVRRRRQVKDSVEFYSGVRAQSSIRRADVVLMLLDATQEVSQVDKKLAAEVVSQLKPCVVVVNKWDLAGGVSRSEYEDYLEAVLPGVSWAPLCFVSALRGRRVHEAVSKARSLWERAQRRVPTGELNRAVEELRKRPERRGRGGKRPKVYYATQTDVTPPTIVLFVNAPERFTPSYRRFVNSFLRRQLGFHDVPVAVHYRRSPGRRQGGGRSRRRNA